MAKLKKAEIKEQLQECARQCYQPILLQAGFRSYQNDDLNWYKLEGRIVKHVHLCSFSLNYPVDLELYYGAHPVFINCPIPPDVISRDYQLKYSDEAMRQYFFPGGRKLWSRESGMNVPNMERSGAEHLTKSILPAFDRITNEAEAYQWHKKEKRMREARSMRADTNFRYTPEQRAWGISPDLVDEAILAGEEALYSLCLISAKQRLELAADEPKNPWNPKERLRLQIAAIEDGALDEFREGLQKRAQAFLCIWAARMSPTPSTNTVCK